MPCAAVANGSTQGCKAACQRGSQGGSRHCWQVELTRHHSRQVPCENVFAFRTTYIYIYIMVRLLKALPCVKLTIQNWAVCVSCKALLALCACSNWYNLPAPQMTDEVKRDLRLLKLRGVMDPKRFYKSADQTNFPKYFQFGTVVEGPTEFYSGKIPYGLI